MLVSWLEADSRSRRVSIGDGAIAAAAMLAELAIIISVSVVTGLAWHGFVYGASGDLATYVGVGAITGLIYTLPFMMRADYRIQALTSGPRATARIVNVWTYAFFCLAALAFLTKTTGSASRGWLGLFFVMGGLSVLVGIKLVEALVAKLVSSGVVAARSIIVLGDKADVEKFAEKCRHSHRSLRIASATVLPDADENGEFDPDVVAALVKEAASRARVLNANDVVILAQSGQTEKALWEIAKRFLDLPVAVHLARTALTEEFPNMAVGQVGAMRTLTLRSAPLNIYQLGVKRALDLVLATIALVLLLPLFAIVALLIKQGSKGPVFFRQRRLGYNQREFSIWKFRTMTTMDDGDRIEQARVNDPRVTRIGAILRRYNIDELPQLINVIRGEMSLVGPRPHAVAHDRHYEQIIKRYPRRLNVKPGITGWAQVNGYRGATERCYAMRSRIAHDLFYIDNWSLAFDLYIMAMTVISPKAFRNAH